MEEDLFVPGLPCTKRFSVCGSNRAGITMDLTSGDIL